MIISIAKAEQTGDQEITIDFNEGTSKTIDFGDYLKNTTVLKAQKYRDPELFGHFTAEFAELVWPNGDMLFDVSDLYKGELPTAK